MVYSRARLSPVFLHGLQLGMRNSPPQIDNTILFITSPQSMDNLCCTSPQILTTIFAAPHHRSALTTIFATPYHRSTLTNDLCCTSPHIHTATTISNLAYRNPYTCTAKVGSNLEINTLWGWGLKLRSARCKRRRVKLTSLRDSSSLIFEGAF